MKGYYRTKHFVIFVVVFYFIIGIGQDFSNRYLTTSSIQIIPFFSWSLFSKPPSEVNDYSIRIISYKGQKLDEPLYIEEADWIFPKIAEAHAHYNILALGKAAVSGDKGKTAEVIMLLESLYPGIIENMNFEIVKRKYNPLERLKYDRYEDIQVVGYVANDGEAK